MIFIIGLGNPGVKFKDTRHNIGFMAVDFFAQKNDFPEFILSKKYNTLVSEKREVMLVKPQTFMNNSGIVIKKILNHKSKILNLIVVHDDIDLPLGIMKIVKNRGSAGHKGVESIIKTVGNKNLIRLRIGIQPKTGKPKKPESFVIKNFTPEEKNIVEKTLKKTAEALNYFIENDLEKTMNKYNG